jgi:hypothetical protein
LDKKNHAISLDKKSHETSLDKKNIMQPPGTTWDNLGQKNQATSQVKKKSGKWLQITPNGFN